MYKPTQVELQLDWPQLPYSETFEPITAGGNLAQHTIHKKGPYSRIRTCYDFFFFLVVYILIVELKQSEKDISMLCVVTSIPLMNNNISKYFVYFKIIDTGFESTSIWRVLNQQNILNNIFWHDPAA